jgi:hypothetical protein
MGKLSIDSKAIYCFNPGMNPTKLLIEIYGDDSDVEDIYPLDAVSDGCVPPGEAGELIRQNINQHQCEKVRVVKLAITGEFFLRWDERHPELVSPRESFLASLRAMETEAYKAGDYAEYERYCREETERKLECRRFKDILPPRKCELPLTREQAFALVVAVTAESRFVKQFQPDIDALWG